jgi:hypothetical protein
LEEADEEHDLTERGEVALQEGRTHPEYDELVEEEVVFVCACRGLVLC